MQSGQQYLTNFIISNTHLTIASFRIWLERIQAIPQIDFTKKTAALTDLKNNLLSLRRAAEIYFSTGLRSKGSDELLKEMDSFHKLFRQEEAANFLNIAEKRIKDANARINHPFPQLSLFVSNNLLLSRPEKLKCIEITRTTLFWANKWLNLAKTSFANSNREGVVEFDARCLAISDNLPLLNVVLDREEKAIRLSLAKDRIAKALIVERAEEKRIADVTAFIQKEIKGAPGMFKAAQTFPQSAVPGAQTSNGFKLKK